MPEVLTRTNGPIRVHFDPSNQTRQGSPQIGEWGEPWRFLVENTTHHYLTVLMRPVVNPADASLWCRAEIATNGAPELWGPAPIDSRARGRVLRLDPRQRLKVAVRFNATMPARMTCGLRVVPVGR